MPSAKNIIVELQNLHLNQDCRYYAFSLEVKKIFTFNFKSVCFQCFFWTQLSGGPKCRMMRMIANDTHVTFSSGFETIKVA